MKGKLDAFISFDLDCPNNEIDEKWQYDTSEEWAEMLKEELKKFIEENLSDEDDLTITSINTEVSYLEDVPKKENK